jgi:tetratricopeptide (TPR) repeat protein
VIEPTLEIAEIERLRRAPPAQLEAYDLLLRAYAHLGDFTRDGMTKALACLDQALALDPAYAQALAASAYARAQCHFQGWEQQDDAQRADAVSYAFTAVELAPNDAQVMWMAAFAIWNMAETERDRARALFERSLQLNPNSAMALTLAGWVEAMCGRQAVGREMVVRAKALSPRDPRDWMMSGVMAITAVIDEDYAEAFRWAEHALMQNRRFAVALRVATVAMVKLGQVERARKTAMDLLAVEPEFTVAGFFERIPVRVDSMRDAYRDALGQAGLPP